MPRFILQLLNNHPITIQGSGNQLRSFLYVEDAVDAILCALFQGAIGEIYNISSQDEISIRELATRLLEKIHPGRALEDAITFVEDRYFNDKRYWITSEPLQKLGWKQRTRIDEGLTKTIAWFREHAPTATAPYWYSSAPALDSTSTAATKEQAKPTRAAFIFGARGWIGGQFAEILKARDWVVHAATARADDLAGIEAELATLNPAPTHIVSMIGRTHGPGYSTIDYLEQPDKLQENLRDNLFGPLTLADVARRHGLHFTYLGTGCIFEYDATHTSSVGFKETDAPNFFGSAYSTVKGYTDRYLSEHPQTLNVRIRMPISSQDGPRNFITKIINYPRICSIPNSMTVLDDILPVLVDAMTARVTGALNATNPGVIDHSTILQWYRDLQNPAHTWEEVDPVTLTTQLVKGRRSNNYLDTTRLETLFPGRVPPIGESVRRILETYPFAGRKS